MVAHPHPNPLPQERVKLWSASIKSPIADSIQRGIFAENAAPSFDVHRTPPVRFGTIRKRRLRPQQSRTWRYGRPSLTRVSVLECTSALALSLNYLMFIKKFPMAVGLALGAMMWHFSGDVVSLVRK